MVEVLRTVKAPKLAFFTWTVAKGRILTLDNLRRRNICVVNRCCMCKNDWESADHLLIHCPFASDLWSFVFSLFGISWSMLNQVVELLACWHRVVGRHRMASVWGVILKFFMWNIWREQNNKIFEGEKCSIIGLKHIFLLSLLEWRIGLSGLDTPSILHFVDLCNCG